MSTYTSLLRRLFQMRPKRHEDINRILDMTSRLGDPQKNLRYVHVTGSNGKGTVCWKLAECLQKAGYKVGLFISPHISCYRERIRVNMELIKEEEVVSLMERVLKLAEQNGVIEELSFFDITLLVAFLYFQDTKVDVVVLEVGIGGRLDSTVVIPPPDIAILTSVSLEHTQFLGDTVEQITWDKAHIIKEKTPAIIGPTVVEPVVRQRVQSTGSPLYIVPKMNNFSEENQEIVIKALKVLSENTHYSKLLNVDIEPLVMSSSNLPCRKELWTREQLEKVCTIPKLPPAVIFDVGHNPGAFENFLSDVQKTFPDRKIVAMIGMSSDKDITQCAQIIMSKVNAVSILPITHMRLTKPSDLANIFRSVLPPEQHDRVKENGNGGGDEVAQVRNAFQNCFELYSDHIVCVCGSFFVMTTSRLALGFDDVVDPEV